MTSVAPRATHAGSRAPDPHLIACETELLRQAHRLTGAVLEYSDSPHISGTIIAAHARGDLEVLVERAGTLL